MKDEKELMWLALLYNSPFTRDLLNAKLGKSGCKADFLRYLGVTDKDKEARIFINLLIEERILKFEGEFQRGVRKNINFYKIDGKNLISKFNNNPYSKPFRNLINRDKII